MGDQIQKFGIGRTCDPYPDKESCMQGFSGENWGKKKHHNI